MDTELLPRKAPDTGNGSFLNLPITARPNRPLRIASPVLPSAPLARGDRAYLRALRAAEMKAWQASGGDVFRPGFTD